MPSGEACCVSFCEWYNCLLIYSLYIVDTVTGMIRELSVLCACEWREMINCTKLGKSFFKFESVCGTAITWTPCPC
jgi:hypothetical protein